MSKQSSSKSRPLRLKSGLKLTRGQRELLRRFLQSEIRTTTAKRRKTALGLWVGLLVIAVLIGWYKLETSHHSTASPATSPTTVLRGNSKTHSPETCNHLRTPWAASILDAMGINAIDTSPSGTTNAGCGYTRNFAPK